MGWWNAAPWLLLGRHAPLGGKEMEGGRLGPRRGVVNVGGRCEMNWGGDMVNGGWGMLDGAGAC